MTFRYSVREQPFAIYQMVSQAGKAARATNLPALAVVQTALNPEPLLNQWERSFYWAFVEYRKGAAYRVVEGRAVGLMV